LRTVALWRTRCTGRRAMRPVILAVLLAACAATNDDCEITVSRSVTLDAQQSDASMALAIHDCRVDVDACDALCARVADDAPTYCDVHFTLSKVFVSTAWSAPNPNSHCEFASPPGMAPE